MQNNIIILALMTLLALPSTAQIDLHSHAITQGYLDYIKANGAAKDSWMQHLTYHKDVQEGASNEWLEPVTDEQYGTLK